MQNLNKAPSFQQLENSFNFQDDDKIKQDLENILEQLKGARKRVADLNHQMKNTTEQDLQAAQEFYFKEQNDLEGSDLLNSKEITLTYFVSRQIELVLNNLNAKVEILQTKLANRNVEVQLERQAYSLIGQLSQLRSQQPQKMEAINDIKTQLSQIKAQLKKKYNELNTYIEEMLKPTKEEVDADVTIMG